MRVYISNTEMPKSCRRCDFSQPDGCGFICPIVVGKPIIDSLTHSRHARCPLIPIPPHGRLIDADALIDAIESTDWYHQAPNKEMVHGANSAEHQAWYKEQDIYSALENAPTIIESTIGQLNSDSAVNEAEEGE